jgi:hypothetical protein
LSKPKTWGDTEKRGRGQSFLICEKDTARALRVHLGYWDAQTLTGLRFVFCSPGFDPQRAHYFAVVFCAQILVLYGVVV